jgi:hypothetical protein
MTGAPHAAGPTAALTLARARAFAALAGLCVLLALAGIVLKHSPVPDNDMWDGCIAFFLDVEQGRWSAWFARLNEHVPLFSRIFYWIDLRLLGGGLWLPALANFPAMLAGWALMRGAALGLLPAGASAAQRLFVSSLLALLLFSYVQSGNVWSAFNIHFFLACILPLSAFLCLGRALAEPAGRSRGWFLGSLALGAASIGTMANGILTLPLLTGMAILARQPRARVAALALASLLVSGGYVYALLSAPPAAAAPGSGGAWHLLQIAAFVLIFVGSAAGRIFHTPVAAGIAGAAVLAVAALALRRYLLGLDRRPQRLALCALAGYVALSGAIAAPGRLAFGIEQAMTERYTTFSLYGIAAALVLAMTRRPQSGEPGRRALGLAALGALVLFAVQLRALGDRPYEKHRLEVAALALALPGNEDIVDDYLYPDPVRLRAIAGRAIESRVGIFADPALRDVAARLGQPRAASGLRPCDAALALRPAGAGERYLAVTGVLARAPAGTYRIWLADQRGILAGVALPGRALPGDHDGWWARKSRDGFDGFVERGGEDYTTWCEAPG